MSNNHVSVVKRIGAGERLSATAAAEIVASLPAGFDPSERGAVTEAVHVWACGDGERERVAIGPAGNQKATDYGRGVDNLTKKVKSLLAAASDEVKPRVMRVNLSGGEGPGASAVVPEDHPAYALLMTLLGQDATPDLQVVPDAA